MDDKIKNTILQSMDATAIKSTEVIQDLWSGYGKILRVLLEGSNHKSIVVKHVQTHKALQHPRGWNGNLGHQRKIKSYEVETAWYKNYSEYSQARVPKSYAIEEWQGEVIVLLEDLNEAGYPVRKHTVNWEDIEQCLFWLANFHASFMDQDPKYLWEVGTYWHLATRPDELKVLSDHTLKAAAAQIDKKLSNCRYKTFVHGDAKLANFCFSSDGNVAGVDFQYVGGGCGMKDVAYFVGSCMNESECEFYEVQLLDTYFRFLQEALPSENKELEEEWRSLYRVAWADFHRFLKGWSPGHWKINSYSERVTKEVISQL